MHQYVKQGHINCGLLKRGPHGTVVDGFTYPILLRAYITYCQILQNNYRKYPNLKDLITLKKPVINTKMRITDASLVQNRLRSNASVTLNTSKQYDQECRQISWTTFFNLDKWFNIFEKHCIGLVFAQRKSNGSIGFIHPERVFNPDKTNISLDRICGNRGGRPTTTFYDPKISRTGNAQNKIPNQCTLIFASKSLGQPLPPHFQLKTAVKIRLCIKIRLDVLKQIPNIYADYRDGRK